MSNEDVSEPTGNIFITYNIGNAYRNKYED